MLRRCNSSYVFIKEKISSSRTHNTSNTIQMDSRRPHRVLILSARKRQLSWSVPRTLKQQIFLPLSCLALSQAELSLLLSQGQEKNTHIYYSGPLDCHSLLVITTRMDRTWEWEKRWKMGKRKRKKKERGVGKRINRRKGKQRRRGIER